MDFRPNQDLLDKLLEMGVSKNGAVKALYYTENSNVDAAMKWLFDGKGVNMDTTLEEELSMKDSKDSSETDDTSSEDGEGHSYKMVFVINESLKMTPGKISAQVGHATLGLYRHIHHEAKKFKTRVEELSLWEGTYERMIVLKGESSEKLLELVSQAESLNLPHHLVEDAGLTQVHAGSMTVLSIFGEDSEVNQVTGKLKLLS